MKSYIFQITALIAFLSVSMLKAQDCEVKLPSINKSYTGDCKKGQASGYGTAEGESVSYEGEFKKGLPEGEGKLIFKDGRSFKGEWKNGEIYGYGELIQNDGKVQSGYFKGTIENFRYMGEEKASLIGYKILKTERLDNATNSFVNSDPNGNSVTIKIFENNIRQITNFEILEITSGIIQLTTNEGGRLTTEIVNVVFPITLGLRYIIPYGTQDTTLPGGVDSLNSPRQIEFIIYEPGQWTVTITHR